VRNLHKLLENNLLGLAEVQNALAIKTRQQTVQVANRADFPAPVARLAATRVWLRVDVEDFNRRWPRVRGKRA
jgi:hypothetical protein